MNWKGENKMGFTNYNREPRLLEMLKDYIRGIFPPSVTRLNLANTV